MADLPSRAEIIDMLRQHVEAGCTDMLADAPVNQFAMPEIKSELGPENPNPSLNSHLTAPVDNSHAQPTRRSQHLWRPASAARQPH